MNVYIENGFNSRKDYLLSVAEDFGIDKSIVFMLAQMLGSAEDFDGLITALEDYCESEL